MNAIDGLIMFLVAIAGLCWLGKAAIVLRMLASLFSKPDDQDPEKITLRAIRKASRKDIGE